MEARYEKVFSLPGRLCAVGAPVEVLSGILLLDHQSQKLMAQLKFKSLARQTINSLTVLLTPLDAEGNPIGKLIRHQYVGPWEAENEAFGDKVAIVMPGAAAFQLCVTEVVFADETVWSGVDSVWEVNPQQSSQPKQKKMTIREKAAAKSKVEAEISPEEKLRKAEEAAQKKAARANKRKKTLKISCVLGVVIVGCALGALLVTKIVIPLKRYGEAEQLLADGQYNEAIEMFRQLEDFKDSEERVVEAGRLKTEAENEQRYTAAMEQLDAGNYSEAMELFGEIDWYKDSQQAITYADAMLSMNDGKYTAAEAAFSGLEDFRDSAEMLLEIEYRRAVDLLENENYDEAAAKFEKLGDYKDAADKLKETNYSYGCAVLADEDYLQASEIFEALGDYQDSSEKYQEAKDAYNDEVYTAAVDLWNKHRYSSALEQFELLEDHSPSKSYITKYNKDKDNYDLLESACELAQLSISGAKSIIEDIPEDFEPAKELVDFWNTYKSYCGDFYIKYSAKKYVNITSDFTYNGTAFYWVCSHSEDSSLFYHGEDLFEASYMVIDDKMYATHVYFIDDGRQNCKTEFFTNEYGVPYLYITIQFDQDDVEDFYATPEKY